jgi:pyruvoyl-dependent arginine decarboxylase (PvlArgDC)
MRAIPVAHAPPFACKQIEVDICPSGLSHGSIANCVIGAMAATEQVAHHRLNAICAHVGEAAAKVCGAFPA